MVEKMLRFGVLALGTVLFFFPTLHASGESVWQNAFLKYPSTWKTMWGSGQDNIFAVEQVNTSKTAIHHFDGGTWSTMDSAGSYLIRGLYGNGPSGVYACGSIKPAGSSFTKGVILKYAGSDWQESFRSDTLSTFSALWVSPSGTVYAAGGWDIYRIAGGTATKMEREQGLKDLSHTAIWGTSDTDIFSVGGGEIRHFNGSRWWRMHQGDYTLTTLWGSGSNDVYATGCTYASGSSTHLGVILHFDGTEWTEVMRGLAAPDSNQLAEKINGIHGTGSSNIYAVGEYKNPDGIWRGVVMHFNGSGWTDITPYDTYIYYSAWCDGAGSLYTAASGGIYRTDTAAVTYTLGGTVKNMWGMALEGVPVTLTLEDATHQTITDENGAYAFQVEGAVGKSVRLAFVMEYRDPKTERLYFRLGKAGSHVDNSSSYRFVQDFVIADQTDLTHDFVVDYQRTPPANGEKTYFCASPQECFDLAQDPAESWNGLEYLGMVYYKMLETVQAYSEALGVVVDPVLISPWHPDAKTAYHPDTRTITIHKKMTVHAVTDFSEEFADVWDDVQIVRMWTYFELEYHEFSHHVMNCLYGQLPPLTDRGAVRDLNHGGYCNPSTADSFTEGFAIFMAQVIQDYLGYDDAGVDAIEGPLETNDKAWEGNGLKEVKAAAGIFWDLYDGIDAADGDAVQLTLGQIWSVLKAYHADMYLVYLSLIDAFKDQKAGIDAIFVNHGFYADEDSGNGQYDPGEPFRVDAAGDLAFFVDLPETMVREEGETIGQATNYERPERYFPPPTEGYFIKTADTYPVYRVSVTFPDNAALNYTHFSELEDGRVYVVVPPPAYDATIRVEGYGTDGITAHPLVFTNQQFHEQIASIAQNGYFTEHAFGIGATVPALPETGQNLLEIATAGSARDGGYDVTDELWLKAILQVQNLPVTLIWREVGADLTPSGDQVISGYFYADPADFAYGSPYNPELFVKIYIATNGWCNVAFNHVTVDPVTVSSAHQYAGAADQTGSATLASRLVEHTYTGVAIDTGKQSSGGTSSAASGAGYSLGSGLWSNAVLQVTGNPVTLVWKEVGTDTTPSGAKVVSGYFYADPADFAYGSAYNPELFVKVYIDPSGWANVAFNHVTVDAVTIASAHDDDGAADQSGTATLASRLVEHQYNGVGLE